MTLPAHILERLPSHLRKNSLIRGADSLLPASFLPASEAHALGANLLEGALPRGGVTELMLHGGHALGTTIALKACALAQEEGRRLTGKAELCAFVDPGATLHAPSVRALGVDLERLLVVRPEPSELMRATLRLAEAQIFSVLVVDTLGQKPDSRAADLGPWVRAVRRLSLALEGTKATVLLLTEPSQRRSLPLPVLARFELCRPNLRGLEVRAAKQRGQEEYFARQQSAKDQNAREPLERSSSHVA
jgi:recombination protein RecA